MSGDNQEMYSAIVVAFCDKSKGYCYNGGMPWPYIKKDHEFYMNLCTTTNDPDKKNGILKGRYCWETMSDNDRDNPKTSIVVTSTTMNETPQYCRAVVKSYDEGMEVLMDGVRQGELENIWVLGGKRNYQYAIDDPRVTKLYITRIFQEFPTDGSFPEFEHKFQLVRFVMLSLQDGRWFETWEVEGQTPAAFHIRCESRDVLLSPVKSKQTAIYPSSLRLGTGKTKD